MLEVYFGTDTNTVRKTVLDRAAAVVETGTTITTIDSDAYTPGIITDTVGATSLFGERMCVVIDTPSADDSFATEVADSLAAMAESTHTFIIMEGPLLAAAKKQYTKHAAASEEFKQAASERFNTFALADALVARDKRQLWLLLQDARRAGLSNEELIGTLWWQWKTVLLTAKTSSPAAAELKPFVYNKAKRAQEKYSATELPAIAERLLTMYHDGHRGRVDLDLALERFALSL